LKKLTCVSLGDSPRVSDHFEAEAKTLPRKPTEFYIEYEVKARLTLKALESIIRNVTPYLDPVGQNFS